VKGISAEQMDRYIENNNLQDGGDSRDISSAFLLKAIVREEEFEDPDEAYLDRNAVWEIASQKLCRIILEVTWKFRLRQKMKAVLSSSFILSHKIMSV
jgi:hypothetical protein